VIMAESTATQPQAPAAGAEVQQAELPQAEPRTVRAAGGQLDILLEATMEVSARLGQAGLVVRDLIQLGPGSVVTLDRRVGEPVELLLRGIPFAIGRLVVVGEQLGVKIEKVVAAEGDEGG